MKNRVINTIKVPSFNNFKLKFSLFLIIFCSFVGVGFVSGAEIYEFFLRFNDSFYLGLLLFFVLVYAIIFKMLYYSKIEKNVNFLTKNQVKNNVKEFVFGLNSFAISSAMFAGLKYFLGNIFQENFLVIYTISLVIVFLILVFGIKLLSLFDIIVFLFILGLFVLYIFDLKFPKNVNFSDFFQKNALYSIFFAVLYVFMNLLQMQPLIEISEAKFASKKDCKIFSIIVSGTLTLFLLVFIFMLKSNIFSVKFPMPFLEIFKQKNIVLKIMFCIGLVLAIVSTQVSGLIGLKNKLTKIFNLKNILLSFLIFLICFLFGLLPFKFFVEVIYPILGVINFITIVFC